MQNKTYLQVALCTTTVYRDAKGGVLMAEKDREKVKNMRRQPRASITFPPKLYRTLETLAKEKKVSIAWVVREAAEIYVAGLSAQSEKAQR